VVAAMRSREPSRVTTRPSSSTIPVNTRLHTTYMVAFDGWGLAGWKAPDRR
jgi:hypothetical protein